MSTRPKRAPMQAAAVAFAIAACLSALGQNPEPPRATTRELSIACNVDAENRTVGATVTNRSNFRVNLPFTNVAADYSVDPRTQAGARVPLTEGGENTQLSRAELARRRKGIQPISGSGQFVELGPGEDRVDTVYLKSLYQIPEQGGTFRLHVGRRLPDGFEPNETLWCPVVYVVLPPSK